MRHGGLALQGAPTAFTPFALECDPAPTYELQALLKAQEKANEAAYLAENQGAEHAMKLTKRALDRISMVQGWFTYYAYRMYSDLQTDIHEARFELEQAAQSVYSEAPGSKAGDLLSCAVDDLMPYDPFPNMHPMDSRLSCMPVLAGLACPKLPRVPSTARRRERMLLNASQFL
eukprot:gb/GFBE01014685.1/.p1 GENE.gb/GFBE01014685.1/~~gb/GFBE01014685.1/.p1  ORF type:complete len:174 (+),score=23.17 gb/GFBE01014685.1/:1-522(+)